MVPTLTRSGHRWQAAPALASVGVGAAYNVGPTLAGADIMWHSPRPARSSMGSSMRRPMDPHMPDPAPDMAGPELHSMFRNPPRHTAHIGTPQDTQHLWVYSGQ